MSWLGDYLAYTRHQESPELFHFWVGLTTMAATVSRNVWLPRRSHGVSWYNVYPGQMMTILIAPSGKGHKGTAMRLGRHLMQKAGVKVIKGKGSTEKIISEISNKGVATIVQNVISQKPPDAIATLYAPELSVLLSKQTYAETLIDFLTDIYDAENEFTYMTQSGGVTTLHNPCLTMIAGATPVSIGDSIPEKAHSHGFLGRLLAVYHDGREKEPDPLVDLDDTDVDPTFITANRTLEETLVRRLLDMKKIKGPASFTTNGRDWYKHWYAQWFESAEGQGEGYATRRPDHLARVAMLLRLSEFGDTILDESVLSAADVALSVLEKGFPLAFAHIGHTKLAKLQERIVETIQRAGGRIASPVLKNKVIKYFNDIDELKLILRTLDEAGLIKYLGIAQNVEWWGL